MLIIVLAGILSFFIVLFLSMFFAKITERKLIEKGNKYAKIIGLLTLLTSFLLMLYALLSFLISSNRPVNMTSYDARNCERLHIIFDKEILRALPAARALRSYCASLSHGPVSAALPNAAPFPYAQ